MNQLWRKKIGQSILLALGCSCLVVAHAQDSTGKTADSEKLVTKDELKKILASYPSSGNSYDGDKLKIRSNIVGFKPLDGSDNSATKCAPISTKMIVSSDTGTELTVNITNIPKPSDWMVDQEELDGLEECKKGEKLVNLYTAYKIDKATLSQYGFNRTGVEFGALVVPFKFHLGVNEFSSSPTVAPYIGWSSGFLQDRGVKFTPIFSSGLAMVPITPKDGGTSKPTPALSTALGVILTSDKNQNFNAGFLFGHDFLGKSERNFDRKVGKSWISFYVGYNTN
ncbi:hypothetical protein [Undibacterium danionis]|uniref:Uncharacterized protein n=1 Tax=Undibacterium danionis TaxID=1812100 RepID=A0ABV6IDG4_9BURK